MREAGLVEEEGPWVTGAPCPLCVLQHITGDRTHTYPLPGEEPARAAFLAPDAEEATGMSTWVPTMLSNRFLICCHGKRGLCRSEMEGLSS